VVAMFTPQSMQVEEPTKIYPSKCYVSEIVSKVLR
jgi:hypothetical protein